MRAQVWSPRRMRRPRRRKKAREPEIIIENQQSERAWAVSQGGAQKPKPHLGAAKARKHRKCIICTSLSPRAKISPGICPDAKQSNVKDLIESGQCVATGGWPRSQNRACEPPKPEPIGNQLSESRDVETRKAAQKPRSVVGASRRKMIRKSTIQNTRTARHCASSTISMQTTKHTKRTSGNRSNHFNTIPVRENATSQNSKGRSRSQLVFFRGCCNS